MALKLFFLAFLIVYIVFRVVYGQKFKPWKPWLDRTGLVVVIFAVLSLMSFGDFVRGKFINDHDVYHYYFGSKYSNEHQYLYFYDCTFLALEEVRPLATSEVRSVRSLKTYNRVSKTRMRAFPQPCSKMFGKEKWAEFKHDLRKYDKAFKPRWRHLLGDKGYNATPFWNSIGKIITAYVPAGRTMVVLACFDIGLIALSLILVFEAFGLKGIIISILILGGGYELSNTHIRNGFLRLDWLAALFGVISMLRLKRPRWAGFLLAYATAIRVFPLLFIIAPFISATLHFYKHYSIREFERNFIFSFVITSVGLLGLALIDKGGLDTFSNFYKKISVHQQDISTTRVGLDYALIYEGENSKKDFKSINGKRGFRPYFVKRKQARKSLIMPIKYAAISVYLALLVFYLRYQRRNDPSEMMLETFLLGFPLVYLLLNPTFYYYVYLAPFVLGFSMLRKDRLMSVLIPIVIIAIGCMGYILDWLIKFDYKQFFNLSFAIGVAIVLFSFLLFYNAWIQKLTLSHGGKNEQ